MKITHFFKENAERAKSRGYFVWKRHLELFSYSPEDYWKIYRAHPTFYRAHPTFYSLQLEAGK
jgi:hypothetical protein